MVCGVRIHKLRRRGCGGVDTRTAQTRVRGVDTRTTGFREMPSSSSSSSESDTPDGPQRRDTPPHIRGRLPTPRGRQGISPPRQRPSSPSRRCPPSPRGLPPSPSHRWLHPPPRQVRLHPGQSHQIDAHTEIGAIHRARHHHQTLLRSHPDIAHPLTMFDLNIVSGRRLGQ